MRSTSTPEVAVSARGRPYPGGKNGSGVYQTIINQMPPHRLYVEPFLGGGAVMRHKRPALASIGIDCDASAVESARYHLAIPGVTIRHGCALAFLANYDWKGDELVYCDPPYLMETRRSKRPLYRHEFGTEEEHEELLSLLLACPAMVILSGYANPLYAARLAGWRTVEYQAMTRGGTVATETLWMNYPTPAALHDYRYLGSHWRERERLRRQQRRWTARLNRMPDLERYALLAAIEEAFSPGALAGNGERRRNAVTIDDTARNSEASRIAAPLAESDAPVPEGAAAIATTDEATRAGHATNDDAGSRRQK